MTPDKLKDLRVVYGYTQNELATLLGVDRATLQRWEGGQTPITKLAALAISTIKPKTGGNT